MSSRFANVRQVMMKSRRGAKCPFLDKFLSLAIAKEEESFVAKEDIFGEYTNAVALWTQGDSVHGQTKYLMKKRSFYKASAKITSSYIHNFKTPEKVKKSFLRDSLSSLAYQTPKLAASRR